MCNRPGGQAICLSCPESGVGLQLTRSVWSVSCEDIALFISGQETLYTMESLILAQDERWLQAYHMQVEGQHGLSLLSLMATGARVSNAYPTCPYPGHNLAKASLIPDVSCDGIRSG